MRYLNRLAGYVIALLVSLWRRTCRYATVDDPRPALRAAGRPYVIALLHAHQVSAVLGNDEPRLCAMVSRSADGDLLVPSLRLRGVEAVRGSSRSGSRDKGGLDALSQLVLRVSGGVPALLAVDGPNGPRGRVRLGVAELARRTGAAVVPLIVVPSRCWQLEQSWDRLQIPLPFTCVTGYFGAPIEPDVTGSSSALCGQIRRALDRLETRGSLDRARGARPPRSGPASGASATRRGG